MSAGGTKARTVWLPLYSDLRRLLETLDGAPSGTVAGPIMDTWEQRGTPQRPIDWSEPARWIPERLQGDRATLAQRLWDRSDHTINPRHIATPFRFLLHHGLLAGDDHGILRTTDRGRCLLADDDRLVGALDQAEGLPQALGLLAARGRARVKDLLPESTEYVRNHATFGTTNTIRDALYRRFLNLAERGHATREGSTYSVADAGLRYAGRRC